MQQHYHKNNYPKPFLRRNTYHKKAHVTNQPQINTKNDTTIIKFARNQANLGARKYVISTHFTRQTGSHTKPYVGKKTYNFLVPDFTGHVISHVARDAKMPVLVNLSTYVNNQDQEITKTVYYRNLMVTSVREYNPITDSNYSPLISNALLDSLTNAASRGYLAVKPVSQIYLDKLIKELQN